MKKAYGAWNLLKKMFCGRTPEEELKETIESMIGSALILRPISIDRGDTLVLSCPQRLREDARKYLVDSMKKFIDKKSDNVDVVILEEGIKVAGVIKHGIEQQRPDSTNLQP